MPKYAHYNSKATQPTPVLGWYDTDIAHYPNLPKKKDLLTLTQEEWDNRFETSYVDKGKLSGAPNSVAFGEAKRQKLIELKEGYSLVDKVSFTTGKGVTGRFGDDVVTTSYLYQMIMAFIRSQATPKGFYLTDADGNKVPMTYSDLQGLGEAIGIHSYNKLKKLDALSDEVNKTKTLKKLEDIVWER